MDEYRRGRTDDGSPQPGNGRVCEFGSWQPQTGPAAERRLKGSQTGVWCMIYAALVLPACQNCALLPSNPATIVVTLENLRYDRESHVVFTVPRTGPGPGSQGDGGPSGTPGCQLGKQQPLGISSRGLQRLHFPAAADHAAGPCCNSVAQRTRNRASTDDSFV